MTADAPQPYYERDGITLYCGDCRDVLPRIRGDVLMTDPDYGVGVLFDRRASGVALASPPSARRGSSSALNHKPVQSARRADRLLSTALRAVQVERNGLVFWSGSIARLEAFQRAVKRSGWRIHHLGIWYKANGAGPSGNGLARRFEPWFWLEKGKKTTRQGEWQYLPDCIDVSRIIPGHNEACSHPTQKPEELMRRLVRFFTVPGDTIIDPFAGSGTTLRAAKDLGRRAIGVELNEEFCEMAVRRLAQAVLPEVYSCIPELAAKEER